MSILVEVSKDGNDWEQYDRTHTKIDDYLFIRHIDTVERSWSRAQIENWFNDKTNAGARIEYSTDDGFSFVPFRPSGRGDDAARIWTVVQNHRYTVRSMTLTEQLQQFNQQTKTPNVRHESRWVFGSNNTYVFTKTEPRGGWVSRIDSTIVMSLSEPNTVDIQYSTGQAASEIPAMFRGHIYSLKPCYSVPFKWDTLIKTHRKDNSFDARQWVWVECARVFGSETLALGGNIYAMTILSDKYFVDSVRSPTKLGFNWLIRAENKDEFIDEITRHGGVATWEDKGFVDPNWEPKPVKKESTLLEQIMSVKAELQAAIESRDEDILAKVFFEAVEFRDKAVDELKELNTVIVAARQAAMEIMDGRKS